MSMFPLALSENASQNKVHGESFPLIYSFDADAVECDAVEWAAVEQWIKQHRDELNDQAATHGAILFRGLPLSTADDFHRFVTAFNLPNFAYKESLSNAVRTNLTDRVFTANEAPADVEIFLHHEMAQTPIYPSKLFFFCERAPEQGGATPICRSDALYELLREHRAAFAEACATKGLQYSNVMPAANDAMSGQGRSWQSTFGAGTKDEAEQRMKSLGYSWQWLDDDCLRATTPTLPAVRDLGNGRRSFFNQLIAAFRGWKDSRNDPAKSITYGDGSPLNPDDVMSAATLGEQVTFDLHWQPGDVALVDNYVAMHGRRPFVGSRRVLASLVAP